jgi:acyl-CoA synthetase (AMP-forming)/AMP-acid ligase II
MGGETLIIPFLLERALDLYEDKEAVICSGKRFTYGQFGQRVFRLGRLLKGLQVQKGDRIALLHRNMHHYLEVYFAAAQIGAILNPLNYRLSARELDFILQDSGAKILITEDRFRDVVAALKKGRSAIARVIWTGSEDVPEAFERVIYEQAMAAEDPTFFPPPEITGDDIAHLYYTSGTTGKPKGVMLSHTNVCTHALSAIAELRISDQDRWIHVAPLFHLADAWATFAMTWAGGSHVLVPEFEPLKCLSVMEQEKVTITNMIPTMLNMLVNTNGVEQHNFSKLRVLLSGGAPIAPEIVKKIIDTFHCDYVQTYGMTETSPYLTLSLLKDNLLNLSPEEQFVFMAKTGRPFMGVLLKVVREDGSMIRPDNEEVGEIIVKGDIVTKGYWNRPDETAKAIREGWLYTGDMAVLDQEGYVNIVDRKKDMIITGGENVYSIEVENILYTHEAVLEAAVVGVPHPKWGEAVKAFVVLKPGMYATEENIIEHCKERMAGYKAPKLVAFLSSLPKTGSGKIFKKALKE